jgi:uncharacterized membrane protein
VPLFLALTSLSQRILTFFYAMTPIGELRLAIPYAVFAAKLPWQEAVPISIVGNFVPVMPVLFFLEYFSQRLMRYPFWHRVLTWAFERTRRRSAVIERFEAIGLILFVGIPLPFTGAWSGCIAAFLFRIPLRLAVPCIILGILLASVIVTLVCLGVLSSAFLFGALDKFR